MKEDGLIILYHFNKPGVNSFGVHNNYYFPVAFSGKAFVNFKTLRQQAEVFKLWSTYFVCGKFNTLLCLFNYESKNQST